MQYYLVVRGCSSNNFYHAQTLFYLCLFSLNKTSIVLLSLVYWLVLLA